MSDDRLTNFTTDASQPGPPGSKASPPPHPLDNHWYIYLDDAVYGPYTGHQLKDYKEEGRINAGTNVARDGAEEWIKASDDPRLASLFVQSVSPKLPPTPPNITAAPGATVVQVTNQIGPALALAALEPGEFGNKSPGVALLISILICGGGQMYNGQVAKGILMLFGCILLWIVALGWIINIWSWIDAYSTAKKMRARYLYRLNAGVPV
jgi:TM2 domain-containing membrane protein YozV